MRFWPVHRKVTVAIWIPVGVLAFAFFTGPNQAPARAVNTVDAPTSVPVVLGTPTTMVDTAQAKAQEQAISEWIRAVKSKRTLVQEVAVSRFNTARYREILGLHRAATKAQALPTRTAAGH